MREDSRTTDRPDRDDGKHANNNVMLTVSYDTILLYHLVILWGGMNSLCSYEFTVFFMGPFSANNIMNHLGKFITAVSIMVLGSGITVTGP